MTEAFLGTLGHDALKVTLLIGGPMLGVSLLIGLLVSLFQAMTQINEQTLTFVPKIVGFGLVLLLAGPWMLQQMMRFTVQLLNMMPNMVR